MREWMHISPFCYQHPHTAEAPVGCLRDVATNFRDSSIVTHRIKHLILDTTRNPSVNIRPEWRHYRTVSDHGNSSWESR